MSAKANTTATTASMHPAASRLHSRRVVISTEGMDPKIARRNGGDFANDGNMS